ncbi:hypothetical protein BMF94_6085 [Rhodotorula taiwanensis]|uniref:DUF1682-domain-containing protein n=1 Tax=Rhodotorula taiwanensis TaxID=741276 RepID=A0A2S5B2A2_9BASI|nr:hypothetical protein BMF94_6085 [Rhodotorula taiwanensis]
MDRRSAMYAPGTAIACLAMAGSAQAAWGFNKETPLKAGTPVDAADPVPAAAPQPVDPLYPEVVASPGQPAGVAIPSSRPPYTGTDYSLGPIHFRPAEYRMEGVMLAFLAAYLASTFLIRQANRARASKWFSANEAVLREEFAGVGLGGGTLFKGDGGDEFVSYATGRRGCEYVWTKLRTGAQDAVGVAYHLFRGIIDYKYEAGTNKVVLDFKLAAPKGTPGAKMVFAVVRRDLLRRTCDARWDLRTFTNVSETPGVSPSLIVMTESGDVTNALLKDVETGLMEAFKDNSDQLEYFESLIISDMPAQEPSEEKPTLPEDEYRMQLRLRLPSASRAGATAPWITLACNVADVLHSKQKLVPDVAISKAKKRRADALELLMKPLREEEAERAAEAKQNELALKRKLELDRREAAWAKLSPAERIKAQKKEEERERKSQMKKQAKRQQAK